jgi:hypothetical protein
MRAWLGLLVLSAGCGASMQQLKNRASIDLDCDIPQLAIRDVDAATRRVNGCGKQAIYVEQFNHGVRAAWLLDSPITPSSRISLSKSP